jgi:hypothetical protein
LRRCSEQWTAKKTGQKIFENSLNLFGADASENMLFENFAVRLGLA